MSSAAQIAAAVTNAQLSTGPRTPEGKAISSRNATKLGLYAQSIILPGEDPAEFELLSDQFLQEFTPVEDAVGLSLIQNVVLAVWMQRRYLRIESEVVRAYAKDLEPGPNQLGEIYLQDATGPRLLEKIARRRQAAERQYNRSLKEALAWRNERRATATLVPADARPVLAPPSNPVRFDKPAYPPYTGGPTPLHTPKDNWDNPALRL